MLILILFLFLITIAYLLGGLHIQCRIQHHLRLDLIYLPEISFKGFFLLDLVLDEIYIELGNILVNWE